MDRDLAHDLKILPARFFQSASGKEPVREWLKELGKEDRRIIGSDIRTVEFGWPIGMPVCRAIAGYKDLWEVRSKITDIGYACDFLHEERANDTTSRLREENAKSSKK